MDCGIRFLTHPRNAGRGDLRCPFGCRRQHRQQRSNERSSGYYRTTSGKAKKKRLNASRRCRSCPEPNDDPPEPIAPAIAVSLPTQHELSPKLELRLEGVVLHESSLLNSRTLPYVRMLVSLIEGVELSYQELLRLLRQALRQHSIARRPRGDYVLRYLHEHPP